MVSTVPVSISNTSGSVTFLATSVTSEGNWLTVDPSFATATTIPSHQLVLGIKGGVIPFATGVYNGQIVLGTLDGAKLTTIPVSLQVSAAGCGPKSGLLFAGSGPVTFQLPPGVMSSEYLYLYNTFATNVLVAPWATTSTGSSWLSTVKNNLTLVTGIAYPTPLGVTVNTAGLRADTSYTGNIELDSSNNASMNIPVTAVVNAAGSAQFAVTPSPFSIGIPLGTAATSAVLQLTNLNSSAVGISISKTLVTNRNWLAISPASATIPPGATITLTAAITAADLIQGPNKGTVNVEVTSGGGGSFAVPVTVNYGIDAEISSTPNPLSITTSPGATNPVSEVLSVSTNSGTVPFSSTAFSSVNQPWLSVKPSSAIASPGMPANLTVVVQPALLPAGPAIGVITLTPSDGSSPLTIPVNVNAGKDSSLSVMPSQVSLVYQTGAASPQPQSLSLTSTSPNNYSVQAITSTGGNWLAVSPLNVSTNGGGAPAILTIQANPGGLAPNTYNGRIVITNASSGAQQIVPITFAVAPPASLSASPAVLNFHYQAGAVSPSAAQSVQLTGTGAAPFTATTSGFNGRPNLLTITPSTGSAPATLTMGLNAALLATLPVGQYTGTVTISSPAIPGGSQTVSVTLVVAPIQPRVSSIVNAANLQTGPVSPGEMVTIFGLDLGGVTVTFDGYAAPLLYVGAEQINTMVPYELSGRTAAQVIVSRNEIASSPLFVPVVETAPAIFSATQSGNGQGAILNQDNSYNSINNPAASGSVIQLFATGEGVYPGATTGAVTPAQPPFPALAASVRVTIGGLPAAIQYAGEAPGLISGIFQVNAVVPADLPPGTQPVMLSVGQNTNSSQTITVAVQ